MRSQEEAKVARLEWSAQEAQNEANDAMHYLGGNYYLSGNYLGGFFYIKKTVFSFFVLVKIYRLCSFQLEPESQL